MLEETMKAMNAAAGEMKELGVDHLISTCLDDDDEPTLVIVTCANPDRIQQLKDLCQEWDDEDDQE